jgi:P27 family predicted phage terminase small subunit
MGRPRKPTALKLLSGTLRKHRENGNEPKPKRSIPPIPHHLSPANKAAWRELAVIADGMGVLTEADPVALEAMAGALTDLRAARAALDAPLEIKSKDGTMIAMAKAGERYYWTGARGVPVRKVRPEVADIADADRRFLAWCQRFGMSPADRARVSVTEKKDEDDPWAVFDQPLEVIHGGKYDPLS